MFINELTEEQGRAMVLLRVFEKIRGEFCGYGFVSAIPKRREDLESTTFKRAVGAAKFLIEKGFAPGVDDVHWVGFVRSIFEKLAPQIPSISQLQNPVHLKDYTAGRVTAEENPQKRSLEELREIYAKVLLPDFRSPELLKSLFGV